MAPHSCPGMVVALGRPDIPVEYWPHVREFVLVSEPGSSVGQMITYCPFCGAELPESLREELCDRLEALGLSLYDPRTPEPFESDAWWLEEGL
jgi:hypothetical protein